MTTEFRCADRMLRDDDDMASPGRLTGTLMIRYGERAGARPFGGIRARTA